MFLDYLSVSNDYGRIYLFNYKICGKQYTGKTTDHFRNRWNNYKSEARKVESGNMKNVSKSLFLQQPDHKGFFEDVAVRFSNKTQGSDPTKRDFYWIRTLRTLYPDGLNIESHY